MHGQTSTWCECLSNIGKKSVLEKDHDVGNHRHVDGRLWQATRKAQAPNTAVKPKQKSKQKLKQTNRLRKEIQIWVFRKSPSEETAATAGYYLSNLEVTPVAEIRESIAKGWEEGKPWMTRSREGWTITIRPRRWHRCNIVLKWRIRSWAKQCGWTAHLHLISLSDHCPWSSGGESGQL